MHTGNNFFLCSISHWCCTACRIIFGHTDYSDIGYSWLVGEDGRAYEGRGWAYVGAHTSGCNSVAVAVSLIGNFHPPEGGQEPDPIIMDATRHIIDCAVEQVDFCVLDYIFFCGSTFYSAYIKTLILASANNKFS